MNGFSCMRTCHDAAKGASEWAANFFETLEASCEWGVAKVQIKREFG